MSINRKSKDIYVFKFAKTGYIVNTMFNSYAN
ncbi:hypothetical protein Q604_UNBC17713G0001, partial [human gut metagenome]